jgi:hypothetical protein
MGERMVLSDRSPSGKANACLCDYHKGLRYPLGVIPEQGLKRMDLAGRALIFKTQKNYTLVRIALPINLLTKVLVVCD